MVKKHTKTEITAFFDKWVPTFLPGWAYKVRFRAAPKDKTESGFEAWAMVQIYPLEKEAIFNVYSLSFDPEEANGGLPSMQLSMESVVFHEISHVILAQAGGEIANLVDSLTPFVPPSLMDNVRHQWFLREEGLINTLAVSLAAAVKDD